MRFGPAGYPSEGKDAFGALEYTRSIGLDALEVGLVRGAKMAEERALKIGEKAKELDIRLSCHAPYYISFNSDKPETRKRSVEWVMDTARTAHLMGAYIIVIHAATYGKKPKEALDSVIEGLTICRDNMDNEGIDDVILGVETMGKQGQFGTLDEISEIMEEVDGVRPVLDVAHVHARGVGALKTEEDMKNLTNQFLSLCGDIAHFHISGIDYGDKGEKKHLTLNHKEPDMQLLADIMNGYGGDCTFICESPETTKDALYFKSMFPRFR
ncbi:MAG: TIM barrel protein [Candidatus Methanomethylophilaceae archaeon]|jgi:deoxyribonuclease-4